jgi:hypothetical protein
VKGAFRGIAVLARGVSPRIVSAATLGSGGATPLSGPELAARLGLGSTWAYFGVANGGAVRPLPDTSAHPPSAQAPPAPAPASPQGGAQAPGAPTAAQATKTGGVAAG